VRPCRAKGADKRELVAQVRLDQVDPLTDRFEVRVARAGPPDDPGHLVALVEQQLGEERAVLASDPGDQRSLLHRRR
jgi:hypothetical protein